MSTKSVFFFVCLFISIILITFVNTSPIPDMVEEESGNHVMDNTDLETANNGIVFRPVFAYRQQQLKRLSNIGDT